MNTLGELNERWNALRNAAFGRGTKPRAGVSAELAAKVDLSVFEWRAWLARKGPGVDLSAQFAFDAETEGWAELYDQLAPQVSKATGIALPGAPLPALQEGVRTALVIAAPPILVAGVVGVGLFVLVNSMRGRR